MRSALQSRWPLVLLCAAAILFAAFALAPFTPYVAVPGFAADVPAPVLRLFAREFERDSSPLSRKFSVLPPRAPPLR